MECQIEWETLLVCRCSKKWCKIRMSAYNKEKRKRMHECTRVNSNVVESTKHTHALFCCVLEEDKNVFCFKLTFAELLLKENQATAFEEWVAVDPNFLAQKLYWVNNQHKNYITQNFMFIEVESSLLFHLSCHKDVCFFFIWGLLV